MAFSPFIFWPVLSRYMPKSRIKQFIEDHEGKVTKTVWVAVVSSCGVAVVGYQCYRRRRAREELKKEVQEWLAVFHEGKGDKGHLQNMDDFEKSFALLARADLWWGGSDELTSLVYQARLALTRFMKARLDELVAESEQTEDGPSPSALELRRLTAIVQHHSFSSRIDPVVMRRAEREVARQQRWQSIAVMRLMHLAVPLIPVMVLSGVLDSFQNIIAARFFGHRDTLESMAHSPSPDGAQLANGTVKVMYQGAILAVIRHISGSIAMWAGKRFARTVKQRIVDHALRLDMAFYDTHGTCTGSLNADVQRLEQIVNSFPNLFNMLFSSALTGWTASRSRGQLQLVAATAAGWVALRWVQWGIDAVELFLNQAFASNGGRTRHRIERDIEELSGDISHPHHPLHHTTLTSIISRIRTVRGCVAEDQEQSALLEVEETVVQQRAGRQELGSELVDPLRAVIVPVLFEAYLNYVSGTIARKGHFALDDALVNARAISSATEKFVYFMISLLEIGDNDAMYRLTSILSANPTIDVPNAYLVDLPRVVEGIEFEEVTFAYPAKPKKLVLRGLTMSIESGSCVAIVGRTGSGKSTVAQLLQRMYDPATGNIRIDGVELPRYQVRSLRETVCVVPQEVVLVPGTAKKNLLYGVHGEVHYESVVKNLCPFLDDLPEGVHTLLNCPKGASLSGGQRQRLAIARAVLKHPSVLVLDEATTGLDSATELAVFNAIRTLLPDTTLIVIAHRLATIRQCDKIFCINDGVVMESGTHEELMEKQGTYHALVCSQAQ